jgi:nitrite reductase (NADH) small subunit
VKFKIGKDSDFNNKGCHLVELKGRKFGIYKVDDTYYAVLNSCPHKAAPLCIGSSDGTMLPSNPSEFTFGLGNRVLRCPWHGWEFDITTGEALFGVSNKKVPVYPVSLENGELYVEL